MDPNNQHPPIRYLSVCSGMEAASVAWHPLGWKPVGFSEIEPFPCAILKHRFPDTPNYGSLTEHHTWPIERGAVDLLVGGTPCQSFSVAGLRKGLEDPRGNLALVFLGLADRIKPRWIVWENVPGVLSSNGGRDFGSFLGALVQLGYGFAYRVLDAQHFGVPQRRRRVFVVACLGDWRAPAEVLLEPDCVRRDTKKGRAKGQGAAAGAEGGVGANGRKWPADTACTLNAAFGQKLGLEDQHALGGASLFVPTKPIVMSSGQTNAAISEDMAHTLNATHETQTVATPVVLHPCPDHDTVGTLCARDFKGVGNQFVQEGKCIPCSEQPLPVIAPTVTTCKGSRGGSSSEAIDEITALHLAQQQAAAIPIQDGREIEKKQNGLGVGQPGDPSYTIDTTGAQAAAIPFRKSKRAQSDKDDETWVEGDVSNTLNNFDLGDTRTTHAVVGPGQVIPTLTSKMQGQSGWAPYNETAHILPVTDSTTHAVVGPGVYENHAQDSRVEGPLDVAPTVAAKYGTGGGNVPLVGAMAVRRLTPVECERLQGFPDNWSRIPWKGKPEEDCPDGPRYKACGNSMAVPVMAWIGRKIAAVEARNISSP